MESRRRRKQVWCVYAVQISARARFLELQVGEEGDRYGSKIERGSWKKRNGSSTRRARELALVDVPDHLVPLVSSP